MMTDLNKGDRIVIDRATLKAIAVDTRIEILKILSKRKSTLSELSEKLKLKNPTISEHLDTLLKADLINKEESERKWKYYSLTEKGKVLVKSPEAGSNQQTVFAFVLSLFVTVFAGVYLISLFIGGLSKKGVDVATAAPEALQKTLAVSADQASYVTSGASAVASNASNIVSNYSTTFLVIDAVLFVALIILTFFLLKKIIKIRKNKIK